MGLQFLTSYVIFLFMLPPNQNRNPLTPFEKRLVAATALVVFLRYALRAANCTESNAFIGALLITAIILNTVTLIDRRLLQPVRRLQQIQRRQDDQHNADATNRLNP